MGDRATPLIVLTKSDQVEDVNGLVSDLTLTVPGVDVHPVSSVTGNGVETLRNALPNGSTIALVGSSGVGKSTLTNALAGETIAATQAVRESDERGKHTTTHRALFAVDGLFVIDTPGMREFGLWDGADHLDDTFRDIEALADACRFRDCSHQAEPGCAVRQAIESGKLDAKRYQSFVKLERELRYAEKRQAEAARLAEKKKRKMKS